MSSKFVLLLTPSLSSGAASIGGGLAIVGVNVWSYISSHQLFYDYLFGMYGLKTLLIRLPDGVWIMPHAIFRSTFSYYVLLGVAGLLVALMVYKLLGFIGRSTQTLVEEWHDLHVPDSIHQQTVLESVLRLVVRLLAVAGWVVYWLIFLGGVVSAATRLGDMGMRQIAVPTSYAGWANLAVACVLLVAGIHLHFVFARLVLLRPRLFSWDGE